MGMSIEDNEVIVAKTIANESKKVRPLAIRVKEFNVRSLTREEVEVSLERLKQKGAIKEYRHRWGFFIKEKGDEYITFEEIGNEPRFSDDGSQSGEESEVFCVDFDSIQLTKYLEIKRGGVITSRVIEKRGEDFYCNNKKIPFESKNSHHYFILDILYGDDGSSRLLAYTTIDKELTARGVAILDDKQKVIQRIRNAVNNGLYLRVDKTLKRYVKIQPGEGIELENSVR